MPYEIYSDEMPEQPELEIAYLREQLQAQAAMLEQTTAYMQKVQEKLEASEKMLREQNGYLEQTVARRTDELKQTVLKLENEVADKSQVQDRLQKTHEELNTLFYRSSHDFRSPICSSRGLINLLRREAASQGSMQYLDMLEESLHKLDALTQTLTTIAEVRQGTLQRTSVSVRELLDDIIAGYKRQFPDHRIVEDVAIKDSWFTDKEVLEQVVRRLLDNAFFYAGLQTNASRQPSVKLKLSEEDDTLKIEICDNGPGIEEDVRPYVFDMFFRGHMASKGNGLGLYFAKIAVEQLDGRLELSNCEDGGLCVQFFLNR